MTVSRKTRCIYAHMYIQYVHMCTDPFTVNKYTWTQGVVSRKLLLCNVKEIHLHVYILQHLYKVPYPSSDQTSIRAFERRRILAACVHEGMVIAGRILRNPPCGNYIRQIMFLQLCETIRNSQCQCCRINKSCRHQRRRLVNLSCVKLNNVTGSVWGITKFSLLFSRSFYRLLYIVFHITIITKNTNFYKQ